MKLVAGVDATGGSTDPSAYVLASSHVGGRIKVRDANIIGAQSFAASAAVILEDFAAFEDESGARIEAILVDETGSGAGLAQELRADERFGKRVTGVIFTSGREVNFRAGAKRKPPITLWTVPKAVMVNAVQAVIGRRLRFLPSLEARDEIRRQLARFSQQAGATGNVQFGREGVFDDFVTAVGLAIFALTRRGGKTTVVLPDGTVLGGGDADNEKQKRPSPTTSSATGTELRNGEIDGATADTLRDRFVRSLGWGHHGGQRPAVDSDQSKPQPLQQWVYEGQRLARTLGTPASIGVDQFDLVEVDRQPDGVALFLPRDLAAGYVSPPVEVLEERQLRHEVSRGRAADIFPTATAVSPTIEIP